ncbi:DNA-primase RepB domain-containing protein [Parasphingorhabdus sp.]|uniref:DNA-primase RepB domain-containing protein n=1 Tax=Parasphingorhabdus sp. TaxID=2709688 RepID=UPI002F94DC1A
MRISDRFAPLAAEANHPHMPKAAAKFVAQLWGHLSPNATTFMASRQGSRWIEHAISGDRKAAALRILDDHPPFSWDTYFCANGFEGQLRKSRFAMSTCLGWCDVDDDDPKAFRPRPNILWETSAGRYQSIWIWNETLDPYTAEQISKGLLRYGGDKGGWSVTKYLRVPGTINHKPERNRDRVRLLRFDERSQPVPDFPIGLADTLVDTKTGKFDPTRFEATVLIRRYRRKVSLFARTLMEANRVIYPDRSAAIYVIVSDLVIAKAENDEIGCILISNPHFLEKHGSNIAMAEREILTIRAKMGDDQ